MCDILNIGSLNIDFVSNLPRLPRPGETLSGPKNGFFRAFGGKGGNSAIMASLMGKALSVTGMHVYMIGMVGNDSEGSEYVKNLVDYGVDTSHVSTSSDTHTGVATIFVSQDGENMIGLNAGANAEVGRVAVEAFPHWKNISVLMCQNELPRDATLAALECASRLKAQVTTLYNPAPMTSDTWDLVKMCDVLVVNEEEFMSLWASRDPACDSGDDNTKHRGSNDDVVLVDCMPDFLAHTDIKSVCLTLGSAGVLVFDRRSSCYRVSARCVEVVDTTGAGDAFCGALAAELSAAKSSSSISSYPTCPTEDGTSGVTFRKSVIRACHVASLCCERSGAQTSYPSSSSIQKTLTALPQSGDAEIEAAVEMITSGKEEFRFSLRKRATS